MKLIKLLLLSFLLISSLPSYAGKIYRFLDEDGVSTMSKSLPSYAAQKGYDVLDDVSLRLIERVYSREELARIQQRQALIDEKNDLIKQQKQAEKQRRLEQRVRDRNLIARYPTTEVLMRSRDEDLLYRQTQINDIKDLLAHNIVKLADLQKNAAEQEISGEKISVNLKKRLSATQREIDNNKRSITVAENDKKDVSQQYNADLERLEYLLDLIAARPRH